MPKHAVGITLLFHLFIQVFFQSGKGAAADNVLDFARVVGGGFLVNSELDEKFAQHGVTLIGALRNLKTGFCKVKSAVVRNGDVAAVRGQR